MSDHHLNNSTENHPRSGNGFIDSVAKNDFETALRKGYWRSVISWFTGNENGLMPFDLVRRNLPVGGQHDIGNQQVELDKIIGSIGRYQDFDRAFLPRHPNIRSRWESIDKAHLQDISLPPIELYKVGSVYFVKDGNHRVSVARERGQAYIDAYVTEIDVPFPIDKDIDLIEMIRRAEIQRFEERTKISKIRPGANMHFTLPGGYDKLLEHIDVHRWYMGENLKREVTYAEAVADWYDAVYLPLVRVIRLYDILSNFPGRTESDLYLWIIEHLYYLREEYQAEVSVEEAASHFSGEFSKRPFAWFINFIRRIARRIETEKV